MKKPLLFIALTLSLVLLTPVVASAQTQSAPDSRIQQRLEEEGLDQAPEEITVPESQLLGEEPTSGFVDDNGNPISIEEHNSIRENESGVQWNNIALVLGIVAIIGGAVYFVKKSKN